MAIRLGEWGQFGRKQTAIRFWPNSVTMSLALRFVSKLVLPRDYLFGILNLEPVGNGRDAPAPVTPAYRKE